VMAVTPRRDCRRLRPGRRGSYTHSAVRTSYERGVPMQWTKPKADVVAVTLEVTAYVGTL